ncbi:hypothetical protein A2866_01345 [Candidatus Roizmanbacteria bacterium RIFCSPHIGHO2_01_FULL_39_8]|uniref:Purine nucleoside phosphorylase n=1 Tax=Candidatus Roizmanbacteria bacterium RIFCSPHIGHO2_01_FULL_39_8 TaxID=1802033 RepID=A0A1F7GRV0_9BACT|nr:MAG: hypothetical protein A2866_01345 [Candidatus Roizmanbacteria bacterium RIFCSPHIGHO2_01_FULL_39_8]
MSNTKEQLMNLPDADGSITNLSNAALIVKNADCVPIVYVDKIAGYIGISHNGWRGSLKRLAPKMIQKMVSLGSKIEHITCALGPAIGLCCYEVDEDFYYEFMGEFEIYAKQIFQFRKGRWHVNLTLLNCLLLREAGVKKVNIDFFPFCTKCDQKRFFSRRRAKHEDFERMFNFIVKFK